MSPLARLMLGIIWLYRHSLSLLMGRQCRFEPTCSVYAAESVRRFGAVKGAGLGLARICRCHPWGGQGHDPVPGELPGKFSSKKPAACDRSLGGNETERTIC